MSNFFIFLGMNLTSRVVYTFGMSLIIFEELKPFLSLNYYLVVPRFFNLR
jgi:hypothetical protein